MQIEEKKGFNFLEELKLGCLALRKTFLDIAQVEPFLVACTIAGLCSWVNRRHFMDKDSICIIPHNLYRMIDNQSLVAIEWLSRYAHDIQSDFNGTEAKVLKMKVDGLCEKHVLEFNGRYFQGCPKCYKVNRNQSFQGDPPHTLNTLYVRTLKKKERIEKAGFKVITKWECECVKDKAQICLLCHSEPSSLYFGDSAVS